MSSTEEVEARHKKEIKALDGEKRAAIKKSKGTKGKKAKEAVAILEAKFDQKMMEMQERHRQELASVGEEEAADEARPAEIQNDVKDPGEEERQRKMEKAHRRREKQREKELQREREIAKEVADAGPLARDVENEQIQKHLDPLNLRIKDVKADGHCLYRAIAAQCGSNYTAMRSMCADTLLSNQDEFAPFCEYTDDAPDFDSYVDRVRSSAEWGGHLEVRALSMALKRSIIIYSAQTAEPITVEAGQGSDVPIRLSYHLQYYSLGEHYNLVEKASS